MTNLYTKIFDRNCRLKQMTTMYHLTHFANISQASYLQVIEKLKSLLRAKGRKFYTFVVGKLNPAKLANFMEVDVYVYVACPETSVMDSKEFLQPIVTPFEMELALTDEVWSSNYVTDLSQIEERLEKVDLTPQEANDSSDEEPHFSLITGGLVNAKVVPKPATVTAEDGSLVTRNTKTEIAKNSPAATFLNSRTYRGLDKSVEVPVELAKMGTTGIAKGYQALEGGDTH